MAQANGPKPSERTWQIPCLITLEDGRLVPDPNGIDYALGELQGILTRIGGVAQLAAVREEVTVEGLQPGLQTTSIFVRWQSFVPKASSAPPPSEPPETESDGS